MGRPKVRPENRQRAVVACIPCKSSKKRCDAASPCLNCIRQNRTDKCHYIAQASRDSGAGSVSASPGASRSNARQSAGPATRAEPRRRATTTHHRESRAREPEGLPSPEAHRMTSSRMLVNKRGDSVYIGQAGSLSFLHLLRQTFTEQIGPSRFAESNARNTMLEAEIQDPGDFDFYSQDDFEQKLVYIDGYRAASSGLLDIFCHSELEGNYNVLYDGSSIRNELGVDDLVLAIGAQCSSFNQSDLQYEAAYFSRGRRAAFAGMLEDPSLDLTRAFLLLAFYMLGACRRNAAFMYLGVAVRSAHSLGLHDPDSYQHIPEAERSLRLRVWKSVRVVDFVTSSILGRPSATTAPELKAVSETRGMDEQDSLGTLALEATYRNCAIVDDIMRDLCINRSINTNSAKAYLDRLRQWRESLPPTLALSGLKVSAENQNQAQVVGNVHVACAYYFGVLLVTRPFLVARLMALLSKKSETARKATEEEPATSQDEVATLAEVCVDSAVYMIQSCHSVLEVRMMLENMCILKAWLFAAGLVVGFSMFVRSEEDPEISHAFDAACRILNELGQRSPQASHYHEIFMTMAEAIRQHRYQQRKGQRRSNSLYVDKIFSLDVDEELRRLGSTPAQLSLSGDVEFPPTGIDAALESPDPTFLQAGDAASATGFDDIFFGLDSFASHFLDNAGFGPKLDY